MSVTQPPTVVLLPGTGSDEVFVRSVFEVPVSALGMGLDLPEPAPGPGLAEAYLRALDRAAERGPVIAGGISFGAHLAAEWAAAHPDRCAGLLLALPAWSGPPADAPAALSARHTAAAIRAHGLHTTLATAIADVPPWLATELTRAWTRGGPTLPDSLDAAATRPSPTPDTLATLPIPTGIATFTDDPIHPLPVAESWTRALPHATLRTLRFETMAADPESLGRATVLAFLRAREGAVTARTPHP